MKKSINKIMTIILAFVAAICFVCAIAMNTTSVSANSEQVFGIESVSVYAGTKDNDDTGIRFTAQISQAKYNAIVDDSKPIYFGVELSVGGKNPMNIVYTVGGDTTGQDGFQKIDFEESNVYKYTATIMYNEQTLAEELAADESFNPNKLSVEEFKSSDEFKAYMQAAFKTEITAKAYYQIGDMEVVEKIYGDNALTNSIWGVASRHYVEVGSFEDCEALQSKYFSNVKTDVITSNDVYVQTDGTIVGYNNFEETDVVYLDSVKVEVEQVGDAFKIKDMSAINSKYTVTDKVQFSLVKISADRELTYVKSAKNDARYVTLAIDDASDFEVFDLDKEYTLADGTTKVGKVVNGYYVMIADVDAEGTNMGLDHQYYNAGVTNGRYNVTNGILGCGFIGNFDGQGHVIKNFVPSVGGIFGRIARGGAVHNVAFYNVTVDSSTTVLAYNAERGDGRIDNSKIPAADAETKFDGLTLLERNNLVRNDTNYITNIYIKLSAETTSANGVITKNDNWDSNIYSQYIIVDASDCNVGDTYSFYFANTNAINDAYVTSGVIITEKDAFRAGNGYKVYGKNQGKTTEDGKISNNRSVYHSYAEFIADSEAFKNNFTTSVWNKENGIFFKGLEDEIYASNIYLQDADGALYTKAIVTDNVNAKFNVVDVYKQPLEIVNFESSNSNVIDYVDGEIKVVAFAMGDYTVSFDVEMGETTKTLTYAIKLSGEIINVDSEAIYDSTENKVYYRDAQGNKKVVSEGNVYYVAGETEYKLEAGAATQKFNGAVVINTSRGTAGNFGALTAINVRIPTGDGNAYEQVSIAYNITNSDYTGVKVKVMQGNKVYNFNDAVFATAVIDDGLELKQIFNKPDTYDATINAGIHGSNYYGNITLGVYMLADNINADKNLENGFKFDNSYLNIFDGLLDGRGYSVFNLDVSGTESKPGNGLFSDTTENTVIQNIAFIDVKANYGSVFMGNRVDSNSTKGTYGCLYKDGVWYDNIGLTQYRRQVGIADEDSTTPITNYMTSAFRTKETFNIAWSNVYVRVHKDTIRLMGVISRQMVNGYDSLSAYNLIIEYTPSVLNDSEDGSIIGALPYGYDYTNGEYGVLFGGTYTLSGLKVDESATKNYYTPSGMSASGWSNRGALNFVCAQSRSYANIANTIYVISPLGLVSTDNGAILGTNESVTDANPYKFFIPKGDHCLERYTSVEALALAGKTVISMSGLGTSQVGEGKLWSFTNGTLVWNNSSLA